MVLVNARIFTPKKVSTSLALVCHRSRSGSTTGMVDSGGSIVADGCGSVTVGCGVTIGVGIGSCWGGVAIGWLGVAGTGTTIVGAGGTTTICCGVGVGAGAGAGAIGVVMAGGTGFGLGV
jgi:hypothetical protein